MKKRTTYAICGISLSGLMSGCANTLPKPNPNFIWPTQIEIPSIDKTEIRELSAGDMIEKCETLQGIYTQASANLQRIENQKHLVHLHETLDNMQLFHEKARPIVKNLELQQQYALNWVKVAEKNVQNKDSANGVSFSCPMP